MKVKVLFSRIDRADSLKIDRQVLVEELRHFMDHDQGVTIFEAIDENTLSNVFLCNVSDK